MTEHEQMVEDCEARDDELSHWERGFIDNVSYQLRFGGSLTEPQIETLEKIWERVT